MQDWALQNKQCHQLLCSNDVCFTVSSPTVRKTLCVLHILHLHSVNSELIYQLDAIEYLFVYYQLDMFRAYTPIFRGNGCYNLFTYTAYGVLGVVRCWSWGVCVLVACCTATHLCTISSTCFGLTRPSSGAMDVIIYLHIQHMVSLV